VSTRAFRFSMHLLGTATGPMKGKKCPRSIKVLEHNKLLGYNPKGRRGQPAYHCTLQMRFPQLPPKVAIPSDKYKAKSES
jgi:hypothetical protein